MTNRPEKGISFAAIIFGVLCFFSMPFILLLFAYELSDDGVVLSWFEIAYHIFNFVVIGSLYRSYLADSLFDAQLDWQEILKIVAICASVIVGGYFVLLQLLPLVPSDALGLVLEGILPMSEMELFLLNSSVVFFNPLFGTLCMVLVVPIVTSCIYYASTFAPICCNRPWLAYLLTALVLALPRIANASTFWAPDTQALLYFAQLPVHMVACWAYQKTDNIWTPVALHAVVNLIGSLLFLYFGYFVWR